MRKQAVAADPMRVELELSCEAYRLYQRYGADTASSKLKWIEQHRSQIIPDSTQERVDRALQLRGGPAADAACRAIGDTAAVVGGRGPDPD